MGLGSYGNMAFEVSATRIRTFRDWTETHRARHAEVAVLDGKPRGQFISDDLSEVRFNMQLNRAFCEPETEIAALKAIKSSGEAQTLQVGGYPVGDGPFILQEFSVAREATDHEGRILSATVSVRLRERRP